jgi:hypothetical protein
MNEDKYYAPKAAAAGSKNGRVQRDSAPWFVSLNRFGICGADSNGCAAGSTKEEAEFTKLLFVRGERLCLLFGSILNSRWARVRTNFVADTGFDVSSGTVLDVIISAKGAGIEGTVVDREGKTFAGASVVSVPSSGKNGRPDAYQPDRTDEKGHFACVA